MDLSSLFWNIVVILDLFMGKFDDPHENPFGEGIEISISKKCTEPIDCIYHTAAF